MSCQFLGEEASGWGIDAVDLVPEKFWNALLSAYLFAASLVSLPQQIKFYLYGTGGETCRRSSLRRVPSCSGPGFRDVVQEGREA